MSYILDALKKSEQERGHGATPNVQTVHTASLSYRNDKSPLWPRVLIGAVLLNFAAISYFIYQQKTVAPPLQYIAAQTPKEITAPATTISHTTMAKPTTEKKTLVKAIAYEPIIVAPVIKTPIQKLPANIETEQSNEAPVADTIIEQIDLPDDILRILPSLTITAHIYSTSPAQRSMVINNQYLEEGDHIIDGLILHEITPTDAILNYHGILFRNNTVSTWQ